MNQVIYIGPSFANSELKTYKIFADGIPEHIFKLCEKYKNLDKLFIAPENLAIARREILTAGTELNKIYKNLFLLKKEG